MARAVTLYSLQWGDLDLETVCKKAKEFGYDGLELGLPDHLDVRQTDPEYHAGIKNLLEKHDSNIKANTPILSADPNVKEDVMTDQQKITILYCRLSNED